jgi:hypothetical protein
VGKPEGRKEVRPRHKWGNNIKMDLREIGWSVVYWIGLAQHKETCIVLVIEVMSLWVP